MAAAALVCSRVNNASNIALIPKVVVTGPLSPEKNDSKADDSSADSASASSSSSSDSSTTQPNSSTMLPLGVSEQLSSKSDTPSKSVSSNIN